MCGMHCHTAQNTQIMSHSLTHTHTVSHSLAHTHIVTQPHKHTHTHTQPHILGIPARRSCWSGAHSLHFPCLKQRALPSRFGTDRSISSQVPVCIHPLQIFSTGKDSACTPTPPPPGDIWRCLDTFRLCDQGRGCHWHRAGGGHKCCSTS